MNIHHLHRDSLAPVTVICRGKSLPWSLMSIFPNSVALCSGVRVGCNKSKITQSLSVLVKNISATTEKFSSFKKPDQV